MRSHRTTNHNDRYVVFYEFDNENADDTADSAGSDRSGGA